MRTLVLIAAGLFTLAGCTSTRTQALYAKQMKDDIVNGDLPGARVKANRLYGSALKGEPPAPGEKPAEADTVLDSKSLCWSMERGLIEHLAGDQKTSDRFLFQAGDLVDKFRSTSVTGAVGSYLVNDTMKDYEGKSYEHIQVDYYAALNQILAAEQALGDWKRPTPALPGLGKAAASAAPAAAQPADGTTVNVGKDATTVNANELDRLWTRAMSRARRMVIDQMKRTTDLQDSALRYADDPWARTFAAVVTQSLPPDQRAADDDNFANSQLRRAVKSYAQQAKAFAADQHFQYEVSKQAGGLPLVAAQLLWQVGSRYDAEGARELISGLGLKPEDPRLALPGKGQGRVLVLNHAGFVAPTQALTFTLGTGGGAIWTAATWKPSKVEQELGFSSYAWHIWSTVFNIKGPDAESVKDWGPGVVVGAEVMSLIAQWNGVPISAVIEFQVPGQPKDKPIGPTASVVTATSSTPMEVVQDVDAYARATLRDLQPGVFAKTLGRMLAKQVPIVLASAAAAKKEKEKGGSGLMAEVFSLAGSSLMSATETADIRNWKSLPDHLEAALITLPVGDQAIAIDGPAGKIDLGTVKVREGRIIVVAARTFPAASTAKP